MFVGVSKKIGGFRIGVGTRISSTQKGPTNKELKTAEFSAFMHKVQAEFNTAIATIIEANGYNFHQLQEEQVDLDEVFAGNADYQEFMSLFESSKLEIEKVLFSGENGVVAKRTITNEVFKIKEFINKKYPGFTPELTKTRKTRKKEGGKYKKTILSLLLGLGILFMPFIFSWVTLRKGHKKTTRIVAFSWLIFVLVIAFKEDPPTNNLEPDQQTISVNEEKKPLKIN